VRLVKVFQRLIGGDGRSGNASFDLEGDDVVLIVAGVTTLAFASSAFACDRLGRTIISPFLAAGAWLFGAFAVLVWCWR
jgi:hypothetical protein